MNLSGTTSLNRGFNDMNSLLLKNVNFIGFEISSLQKGMDVSIGQDGCVNGVGLNLTEDGYDEVQDVSNYYLSPGWIDLHTHVFEGGTLCGVNPDKIGVLAGVTVLVDAGSAGETNFRGFRDYVIKKYNNTQIVPFINFGSMGMVFGNPERETDSLGRVHSPGLLINPVVSEFDCQEKINPVKLYECIKENRDLIKGIKVRASGSVMRGWYSEAIKMACKTSREFDLPLMVHIGETMPLLEDILPKLKEGDIVTHCYHGKRWGLLEKGSIINQALEARERGIKFDVGRSRQL